MSKWLFFESPSLISALPAMPRVSDQPIAIAISEIRGSPSPEFGMVPRPHEDAKCSELQMGLIMLSLSAGRPWNLISSFAEKLPSETAA